MTTAPALFVPYSPGSRFTPRALRAINARRARATPAQENVMPLKRGRSVKGLCLAADPSKAQRLKVEADQRHASPPLLLAPRAQVCVGPHGGKAG